MGRGMIAHAHYPIIENLQHLCQNRLCREYTAEVSPPVALCPGIAVAFSGYRKHLNVTFGQPSLRMGFVSA